MGLMGPDGMLFDLGYAPRPIHDTLEFATDARSAFLRSPATTIEGGTSEIMRNILGERTLGLPGDVRVDKGVPWLEVERG
jgi:hypothetical protein